MRKPVDTQFYVPRTPVAIAAIDGGNVHFLRAVLESLNCAVSTHWIGTPADFLKVLAQDEDAPRYLIIEGHGLLEGIHFGEYGPKDIDTSMLVGGCLPPDVIARHINLPSCTIIGHFCSAGEPAMARAFLTKGTRAYLGCRTEVDTTSANLFLFHFLHGLLQKPFRSKTVLSEREAWRRAVEAVDHEEIYQISFYGEDGEEEKFPWPFEES